MAEPLQKQILIRMGVSALSSILAVALSVITGDIYLWLPCAAAAVIFTVSAFLLFRRVVLGEYVVIDGECVDVGLTPIKRRVKYIVLLTDGSHLKVMLRSRRRSYKAGAKIRLYVAISTPVYTQDDILLLYNYIAISKLAGGNNA